MEENKKKCPFCGAEINNDAKKCRFCGNWLDEEILCPYCAEKIKASAKKCRYCGEWLNKEETSKKASAEHIKSWLNKLPNISKNKGYILALTGLVSLILVLIIGYIMYIPSCKSSSMQSKLKEYLTSNYTDINDITFNKKSAHKLKRIEKGYSCSIDATVNETPTKIEYTYKKVALNEFDINAKFVLPNCFDSSVKKLLNDLIKDSDSYNIKNNTSDIVTKYEKQDDYNKESVTYKCSADAIITSKPGRAFLLNPWDYDNAARKIKCKVDYKSYFCENGYTTCVGLTDLYACEYEED